MLNKNLVVTKPEGIKIKFGRELIQGIKTSDSDLCDDNRQYKKAYNFLLSEVIRNIDKYSYWSESNKYVLLNGDEEFFQYGEVIGRFENKNNKIARIVLPKTQLKNILSRGGFSDIKSILFNWRDNKIIDCDKGRLTKKRLLVGTVPENVFIVNVADEINLEEVISNFERREQF